MGQNAMAINIHCTHTLPKNKHIHLSNLVKIFLHVYRFGLRFSSVCCCCNCCFFSFVFFSLLAFWTFISWSDEQKLAHTLNIYTQTHTHHTNRLGFIVKYCFNLYIDLYIQFEKILCGAVRTQYGLINAINRRKTHTHFTHINASEVITRAVNKKKRCKKLPVQQQNLKQKELIWQTVFLVYFPFVVVVVGGVSGVDCVLLVDQLQLMICVQHETPIYKRASYVLRCVNIYYKR